MKFRESVFLGVGLLGLFFAVTREISASPPAANVQTKFFYVTELDKNSDANNMDNMLNENHRKNRIDHVSQVFQLNGKTYMIEEGSH